LSGGEGMLDKDGWSLSCVGLGIVGMYFLFRQRMRARLVTSKPETAWSLDAEMIWVGRTADPVIRIARHITHHREGGTTFASLADPSRTRNDLLDEEGSTAAVVSPANPSHCC
jgi:hypothetical protein